MSQNDTLPNHLGIVGWLRGGRRGVEGYLYLAHRVTGLMLLLFVVAHVLLSSSRLLGPEVWMQMMTIAWSPNVQLLQYPLLLAFVFHAFNGIRLILVESGIAVGGAELQVYPYRGSVRRQRPVLIAMMVLAALLLVVAQFDWLRLAH